MDPITMVGLASSVLKATGLGEKLGSWIGGDSGGKAAKKVLDIAQEATGSSSPEEAAQKLYRDPKVAVVVKKQLMDHEKELEALRMQDVADARRMQRAALESDDPLARRFVYMLAAFWSIAGAGYMFGITFFPIPESAMRFADTAQGFILGTIIAQVLNFFFGSSKGSADKNNMLKDQLNRFIGK